MAIEDIGTLDTRTTKLDSKLRSSERKRKSFQSRLGPADPVFCVSCYKPFGFASTNSNCLVLCVDCQYKYSLPLTDTENIGIHCAMCNGSTISIPRDLIGKIVYYCEPCERKMEAKPPLVEMTNKDEQLFGIKRI